MPEKVQISMQSHRIRFIVVDLGADECDSSLVDGATDVNTSSLRPHSTEGSRKLLSRARWRNVPGKVRISLHLTYPCKNGRLHVSSRKLPAAGRWKNVPGKVRISSQSHVCSLIVVDLGVDECNSSLVDPNTSSLRQHSTKGSGKLPSRGR